MATVEHHDDLLIINVNAEEQAAIEAAMAALGAERNEVGGGIVLFLIERGVVFRIRGSQPR